MKTRVNPFETLIIIVLVFAFQIKSKDKTRNSASYMTTSKLHAPVPESCVQAQDCSTSSQDAQSVKGILDW